MEATPTVAIAINKSRIKQYNKQSETPVYYLKNGTEFQIELFNPTTDVVLAKIEINNKAISQSGLVLNPGQRVFLDRYLDVAKKFKFETYTVSNTKEVQKAIESNGDLSVKFYREQKLISYPTYPNNNIFYYNDLIGGHSGVYGNNMTFTTNLGSDVLGSVSTNSLNGPTLDIMGSASISASNTSSPLRSSRIKKSIKKDIETGRVEKGGDSDQEFKYVNKDFDHFAFHTVEYKILPESQKPQTVKDIMTKSYCTQCGHKVKGTFKFCPSCGSKI